MKCIPITFNYLHFSYFNYFKTLSVSLNSWTAGRGQHGGFFPVFQLWRRGIKWTGVEHTSPGAHAYTQQPSTACWTRHNKNYQQLVQRCTQHMNLVGYVCQSFTMTVFVKGENGHPSGPAEGKDLRRRNSELWNKAKSRPAKPSFPKPPIKKKS